MKKIWIIVSLLLVLAGGLWTAKEAAERAVAARLERMAAAETQPVPETRAQTMPPETAPAAPVTVPETTEASTETTAPAVYDFTGEEAQLLLKLGMAERGNSGCTECIALVMRTVLNRVEGPKFSSTIKGVIYAQDQFTPVSDGSFETAQPNDACYEALEMIRRGWDESQGALYYEWCEGESWHSQNLNLLLQHCDTRFYR